MKTNYLSKKMDKKYYQNSLKWFKNFIKDYTYYNHNNALNIKNEHTIRVVKNAEVICNKLQLSRPLLYAAKTTALLHDIGRWEQIKQYATFTDSKSFDHGNMSATLVKEAKLFDDWKFRDSIIFAIKNHNKLEMRCSNNLISNLLLKIIRDADKLDALKIICDYLDQDEFNTTIELDLPEQDFISDKVWKSFIVDGKVYYTDLQNINDFRLLQISWIHDINFECTLDEINRQNYMSILLENISDYNKLTEINDRIFLDKKSILEKKKCVES